MTTLLSTEDQTAIAAAIAEAERGTAGEIRVVITTQPLVRHHFYRLMWATLCALVIPWPLALLTPLDVPELLSLQAATFVIVGAVLMLTPLGALSVPGVAKEGAARAAAIDHFLAHGMHQTRERTGVLILVALSEHLVEVVADEGIHSRVGHDAWSRVCAIVLAGARAGRLTEGINAGVREAGLILATHAPPTPGDTNELSDRVIVV
ncbi:TPM domain-containing protein [Bosea sp. 117]|uniref:TPM domain-containing protein n=1 Tax=Bosea sp. 117 TaxID=1125973 RepID=UPI000494BC52|nr:TPM domain-containing protein [Bosea sp. 117]